MFEKLKERWDKWMAPEEGCPSDMLYKRLFQLPEAEADWEGLSRDCGLDLGNRPVQVGIVKVVSPDCRPNILGDIIHVCRGMSDEEEVLPISDGVNQVILVFFADTMWEDQARDMMDRIGKKMREDWPDTRLCMTLGNLEHVDRTRMGIWRKSYRTALGLQDYRYVKPGRKIILYSEIVSRRKVYPEGMQFRFDLLKEALESESSDRMEGWLSGVFGMFATSGQEAFGLSYHLTLEIVVNAVALMREDGVDAEATIGSPETLVGEVLSCDSPEALRIWSMSFLERCRAALLSKPA